MKEITVVNSPSTCLLVNENVGTNATWLVTFQVIIEILCDLRSHRLVGSLLKWILAWNW